MNILDYFGRFHPLVVHLPIGVLSIFLVLIIFVPRSQLKKSDTLIRLILFLSALSATGSSISGLLIANAGSYDTSLVTGHQVLGLCLTLINWILWYKLNFLFECKTFLYRTVMGALFVMMTLTGHAGGSLTHGSDFLTPPPVHEWFSSSEDESKPVTLESTSFEAVSSIFQKKCLVCHGKNKQKGKLRLDSKEFLEQGGENGNLIAETASNSLLIERLLLPLDHEDHMPPEERKQLTELEISYLMWWIERGANYVATLSEMNLPDSLHGILSVDKVAVVDNLIPEAEVGIGDEKTIHKLIDMDAVVLPIASNSNYLSLSCVNVSPDNISNVISESIKIKDQVIWLNVDYHELDSGSCASVGKLINLRKLSLKDTNLEDQKITSLQSLDQLVQLNLAGTNVSYNGLQLIKGLHRLESLFLFGTKVIASEFQQVKSLFPDTKIDIGNYVVPILESDTTVLTKDDLDSE